MPSRNTVRINEPQSYYHVYARGSNKQTIFLEPADFNYFEHLLQRYLAVKPHVNKNGTIYPNFHHEIKLLAYCLMDNHFHLLLYQETSGSVSRFMRSLMTSYSRYFNLKYKRTGPVFESRYKAALINNQNYLEHISRYIHLNPRYWRRYPYSSLKMYENKSQESVVSRELILGLFSGWEEYLKFHQDYTSHKEMLAKIKHHLANA